VQNAKVIYERIYPFTGNLFLTGRTVAACYGSPIYKSKSRHEDFVAYEGRLHVPEFMGNPMNSNLSRAVAANEVSQALRQKMIESLSSPNRLPYGEVSFEEASFVQEALAEALAEMPDDDPYNVRLDQIECLDSIIRQKLTRIFLAETRKEALSISLPELRAALGLSEVEARRLRKCLMGQGPSLEIQPRPLQVPVPNVVGILLEVARQVLTRAKLAVSDEVAYQDALEEHDTVLNQYPNAGEQVSKGQAISLVVSNGPVVIPNVIGLSTEEAISRLAEYSLKTERSSVVTDKQPEGHILETTPDAGRLVPRNSQVVLLIAKAG
jgi:hypothetical protein